MNKSRVTPLLAIATLFLVLAGGPVWAAEIRVQVLDSKGQPIPNAELYLGTNGPVARTDSEGRFVVPDLDAARYTLRVAAEGFAVETRSVELDVDEQLDLVFRLAPIVARESVTVSSGYSILGSGTDTGIAMGSKDIENLPHFGDDLYRAIGALPSASSNDVSSKFGIRGGFARENLVLIDGLEVFEPYHLKDYEGVTSIFDPRVIGGASLYPGAFSARFGDRASGVLEMIPKAPSTRYVNVGASLSGLWLGGGGPLADGKGSWIASVRRGYLDIVMSLAGANDDEDEKEEPTYMDFFGKVHWWLTPRQSVSFSALFADDTLSLEEKEDDEDITAETSYGNWYVWGTHQAFLSRRLSVKTVLGFSHLDQDRDSVGIDHEDRFRIRDVRDTELLTLSQAWDFELTPRHDLSWGFEVRQYDSTYDYESDVELGRAIPDPRFREPLGAIDFAGTFENDYTAAYLTSRAKLTNTLSSEIGVRYESMSLTDESHLGPRLNLRWSPNKKNSFTLGWGHVYQSHRSGELDVQDGETEFYEAERAEHIVAGYERDFAGGWSLRAEAYRRETRDPRVRYENLFDPLGQFPEAAYDRVRIAPTRSTSQGIELFLRAPSSERWSWWASYVYSEVFDRVDGRDQPRSIDQPHALTVNVNYKPGQRWNFNALFKYHTGWPTTRMTAELVEGPGGSEIVPIVGPFYDERLPAYHRIDLRASYTKPLRRHGRLTFFVDVQNLYGRKNLSGYEFDNGSFIPEPDGSVRVVPEVEEWLGLMPSFGIGWEF